jgi:hypothetical protein
MKSIENILSVPGLTVIPDPITLSLAVEPNPLEENLSLVAQPDPMALGLVGGIMKFFDLIEMIRFV